MNLLLLGLVGCATPTNPTGGPPDKEGPQIVHTDPKSGTTDFGGDQIELSFSEFIDRESLQQAILIEPDIGLGYSLDWGRKSVAIEFKKSLPDSTTVIVTIGTDLKDTRNNKMTKPVKIAVSTGPDIDEGEIYGRIADARTGKGQAGNRIFLYRMPAELSQKADYIAETDTSGNFQFSYLSGGRYMAFWVSDQNRSKIWEQGREAAQPFSKETVTLQKAGKDTLGTLFIAQADTSKPQLQGVGLFSSRRFRMRFSENIELTDSTSLSVLDTLGNVYSSVSPLYIQPLERYILFAHSNESMEEDSTYLLQVRNIRDAAGNVTSEGLRAFEGSAQQDTTLQRIIGRKSPAGMLSDEPLRVIYADPITGSTLRDSLLVVEGTELIENWSNVSIDNNILEVNPITQWEKGVSYEFRIWNPKFNGHKNYTPDIWHDSDFGAINFALEDTADSRSYRLMLTTSDREERIDTTFTRSVTIESLPPLEYKAIIYGDLNGNGKWDPGRVSPYKAPEPYFIQRAIPVRSGFTSDVTVVFE